MKLLCSFLLAVMWTPLLVTQDKQFIEEWQKKANSQGAELKVRETGRERIQGRTVVAYRLFATGLPKDQHYTLWTWNLGSKPEAVADAYINQQGLIVNQIQDSAKGISEDPIDAKVFAARGEPKRFAITSDDWSLQAFGEVVPFPIEASSGSCRLSIVTTAADYSAVVMRGTGFKPNAPLSVEVAAGTEVGRSQGTATAEGSYVMVVTGAPKGQRSGKTNVTVVSPDCRVGIQYAWGDGSYRLE